MSLPARALWHRPTPPPAFRFTAVEPGEGTLRLEYVRPWEAGVAPAKEFRVDIPVR